MGCLLFRYPQKTHYSSSHQSHHSSSVLLRSFTATCSTVVADRLLNPSKTPSALLVGFEKHNFKILLIHSLFVLHLFSLNMDFSFTLFFRLNAKV